MKNSKILYVLIIAFSILYGGLNLIQSFKKSLFYANPDRLNFVIYNSTTSFYSIDLAEDRHYIMLFPPDIKIDVPGGYGKYRVGSLGKLLKLENDPDILKRSFAHLSSSFVTHYFYEPKDTVFYGQDFNKDYKKPSMSAILFNSGKAGLFDRLFIIFKTINIKDSSYKKLSYLKEEDNILGEIDFVNDSFTKKSQGFFYQQKFRLEKQSVQIRYPKSRTTAIGISAILEGNGIRVSNVFNDSNNEVEECVVYYSTKKPSNTVLEISNFFECKAKFGKTDVYDIVLSIGGVLEKDWELRQL